MKNYFRLVFTTCLFGLFLTDSTIINAQGVGDLVIIYNQTDTPDDFAFVTFVDLTAGTLIYFTDCGADASGFATPCGEGAQLYTVPAGGLNAGDVVRFSTSSLDFQSHTDTRITGSLALGVQGDQLIAFTDTDGPGGNDPGENPSFITISNTASTAFTGDKTDTQQTGLPAGLSDSGIPRSALGLGAGTGNEDEYDNSVYSGDYDFGSINDARIALTNPSNYLGEDNVNDATYLNIVAAIPSNVLSGTVPVIYSYITLENSDGANSLTWATASEVNNDYFDIEHSLDGENFTAMGRVGARFNARAESDYHFLHEKPIQGMHYYRLKQVDLDGTYTFSEVKKIDVVMEGEVTIYPTMVQDRLNVRHNFTDPARVSIYDMGGQEVISYDKVNSETNLDASTLAPNVYIIRVSSGNQQVTKKFIKQ